MKNVVHRISENPMASVPVVLLDKKSRVRAGAEVHDFVILTHGGSTCVAVLGPAYAEDVGKGVVICTVTAAMLEARVGAEVGIYFARSHKDARSRDFMLN